MAELIVTTPSQPYLGELWDHEEVSQSDIIVLAQPSPGKYEPFTGSPPVLKPSDKLVAPVLLPITNDEKLDCFWECLTGKPVSELGIPGAVAAGSGAIPKSWVGLPRGMGGASRFTNPGSIIAHQIPRLGKIPVPSGIPKLAPVLGRGGVRLASTKSLLRFIGRWVPGIGWALLAADLVMLDQCVAQCTHKRSILRAVCEELTLFCAKPAY